VTYKCSSKVNSKNRKILIIVNCIDADEIIYLKLGSRVPEEIRDEDIKRSKDLTNS